LFLRLSYGGTRTFTVAYRFKGEQRRATLGIWPAMQLAEARSAWRAIRETLAAGNDPAKLRNDAAAKDAFGEVAAKWLRLDQAGNRSQAAVKRLLEVDVLPHWRDKLITEITKKDALELIDAVADRGSPVMARRLHAHLHRLFRWSVGRGIIDANPMQDLPKIGDETVRNRLLSDDELKSVWGAADEIGWPFGPLYQLLILTGARLREIGELRWSEVAGDIIKLEGDRTKNGLPHTIPLSAPTLTMIEELHRIGESDFVFTTNGRAPISGWSKAKSRLDNIAAIKPWHVHDLRRTIATGMQKLGVAERVIEACLGHSTSSRNGLLRVYQVHGFDKEKREALDQWGAHVIGLVDGITSGRRVR
jgi:integrase